MANITFSASDTIGNIPVEQNLSGIVYVNTTILKFAQDRNGANTPVRVIQRRSYDLNNPYEYGAFIEDSGTGFIEEESAGAFNAWSELKNPSTPVDRKQAILESGKPYKYANTKRLALVRPENGIFYLGDQTSPIVYQYDYDSACEKLDFDGKVIPGTNKKNPDSPCNTKINTDDTQSIVETALLQNNFTDFDDYTKGFSTLFKEIGFRTSSINDYTSYNPPRFQLISQSRIVDNFDEVVIGPIRVLEEELPTPRGGVVTDLVVYQSILLKNRRTGEIISGSDKEIEVYRRTINTTADEIYIYKRLLTDEITSTTLYNKTLGMWNGQGTLYDFYTSSIQSLLEKSYKFEVHSGSCDDSKMFTIYYGNSSGGGTPQISNDRQKYGYSKSVYSMFNSLVGNTLSKKIFFTDNSISQSNYLKNTLEVFTDDQSSFINENFVFDYNPYGLLNLDFKNNVDIIQISGSTFYYKSGLNSTYGPTPLIPVKQANQIFAIQVNPNLLKNAIDEGNFELALARISASGTPDPNDPNIMPPLGGWGIKATVDMNSDKVLRLIDNSRKYNVILDGDTSDSYRFKSGFTSQPVFDIVSGSMDNGIYNPSSPSVYGKIYPGYGLIILDALKLNTELNYGIISESNSNGENPLRLYASISGAAVPTNTRTEIFPFNIRQVNASIVDSFEIMLNRNDFNYSTNPSYYANRERSPFFKASTQLNYSDGRLNEGTLRFRQWFYDPVVYLTTIGLYNDDYELLAIGKTSKPIKKSFSDSLKLKVNIKY